MRIAFTVHKFPPESLGGTELYAWSLGRALVAAGHQVHVFYPLAGVAPGERQVVRDGLHLWRAPLPEGRASEDPLRQYWHTFRDQAIERDFDRFLATVQPDLVHFQHVQGVSAQLLAQAAGRPRVVTLHDYWYFCANSQLVRPTQTICTEGPRGGWNCVTCATARADLQGLALLRPLVALPFAYRNHFLRAMTREVDLFLAPSHFLRERYAAAGFPADRIRVIENGLDTSRLDPNAPPPLPEPPQRPHFGFLGSLAWQKGVHVLIDAFNQLPPEATLTIYGSEATFPDYARSLRERAHHPHIRFGGAVAPQQVGAALRQLDCLVVPSVWYENSPLVIQEAFGVGRPVVASRLGALAEKVRDGVDGRLFEAGNADALAATLRALIADPEALAALGRNTRPAPDMAAHAEAVVGIYGALGHPSKGA